MSSMEAIKFLMFYTLQVSVVALVGITLLAGLYQIVRDKVNESRRYDRIAPKAA